MKVKVAGGFLKLIVLSLLVIISSCRREVAIIPLNTATQAGKKISFQDLSDLSLVNSTGSLIREQWDDITGNDVSNIPVNSTPGLTDLVTATEGPQDRGMNYGERIKGYITAPANGNYTFWIAGDDAGELWLSPDTDPNNKVKIASFLSWTNFREWTKFPSQQSAGITLEANHKYYIEILHKQGGGGDHISVKWTLPGNTTEEPVPGSRLSATAAVSSTGMGSMLREEWDNVTGNDISNIPVSSQPTLSNQANALEGRVNYGVNYGERLRGYIHPPQTGNYTFWVAGDDAVELWLSTDDNPGSKVRIANTLSWTNSLEWSKYPSQKSAPVTLQANRKYYIEVLHKQGGGGDNLSVQWTLPDNTVETPIPGSRLSPFIPSDQAVSNYTAANPIYLDGAHDETISGKSIAGGIVPDITLINCSNIHITQNKLYNSADVGIHLLNCRNITIDNNYFTNVSTGVYAEQTTDGGIIVNNNQFLNMRGPFPRGQFVQFNNVNGAGNSISYNKGENIFGQSAPEDGINLYKSSGTTTSAIQIVGNWIRGGGPSLSGGGILLGDDGGSNLYAAGNILVNPGQYGMGIAGGDRNVITGNKIYGKPQYFTNVGIYVNSINGHATTNANVADNMVNFYNSNNYSNSAWLSPNTGKPAGWDGNRWEAPIDETILPVVIITMH